MLQRQQTDCNNTSIISKYNTYVKWEYYHDVVDKKVSGLQYASRHCMLATGVAFFPGDREFDSLLPGRFISGKGSVFPVTDNATMEVMHFRRAFRRGSAAHMALENQFWYYHAPGSGIFLNVGKLLWKVTYSYNYLSCYQARQRGYETIVYQPYQKKGPSVTRGNLIEIVDCRGNSTLEWLGSCPSKYQLKYLCTDKGDKCNCNNKLSYLTC